MNAETLAQKGFMNIFSIKNKALVSVLALIFSLVFSGSLLAAGKVTSDKTRKREVVQKRKLTAKKSTLLKSAAMSLRMGEQTYRYIIQGKERA